MEKHVFLLLAVILENQYALAARFSPLPEHPSSPLLQKHQFIRDSTQEEYFIVGLTEKEY